MSANAYVYFITTCDLSHVKIGISNNPWARLYDLQAGNPLPLEVRWAVAFRNRHDAADMEDALHQLFAKYWVDREWFALAEDLHDLIERLRSGETVVIPRPPNTCHGGVDVQGNTLRKQAYMARLREEAGVL